MDAAEESASPSQRGLKDQLGDKPVGWKTTGCSEAVKRRSQF